jgi:hypothetical protein
VLTIPEIIRRVEAGEVVHIGGDEPTCRILCLIAAHEKPLPGWVIELGDNNRSTWILKEKS